MEERIGTRLDHNSSQPLAHKRGLLGGDRDGGGDDEKWNKYAKEVENDIHKDSYQNEYFRLSPSPQAFLSEKFKILHMESLL